MKFIEKSRIIFETKQKKEKIIMITHDFLQAKRLADEIILIEKGKFLVKYNKQKFLKMKKILLKIFFMKIFLNNDI